MDKQSRDLILAAEISGLLHQLGKLHPQLAPVNRRHQQSQGWLSRIKQHKEWAEVLKSPEAQTILGLGFWILEEIRGNSDLDVLESILLNPNALKNINKTRQNFYKEIKLMVRKTFTETRHPTLINAEILWHQCLVAASLFKIAIVESMLRQQFSPLQKFKPENIQVRLLGIRWNWADLTPGVLKPVVFTALAVHRDEVITQLRQLLEVDHPIGNIIYDDDDGVVLMVPSFAEGLSLSQSEILFRQSLLDPLLSRILNALVSLGVGTSVRIAWTSPQMPLLREMTAVNSSTTLPSSEYTEVLKVHFHHGQRELLSQIGEVELQQLWAKPTSGQVEICPQCGLRPCQARELNFHESALNTSQALCDFCANLADEEQYKRRWKSIFEDQRFGFTPQTLNLQELCQKRNKSQNPARLVLLSARVELSNLAWSARSSCTDILQEIGVLTAGYALPLSLDAQGFRVIVAAHDARQVLLSVYDQIMRRFNKSRTIFSPHLSAVVYQANLPLFVAFDALQRMEQRITALTSQQWQLTKKELLRNSKLHLTWQTPRGPVVWNLKLSPREDSECPYVLCLSRAKEPGRVVPVTDLTVGNLISLKPATFDFTVLENSVTRYQLVYDAAKEGQRYHQMLGQSGRPPYLLEQLPDILELVPILFTKQLKWDLAHRQAFYGQVAEYYEKWVRDVPAALQAQGRAAWHLQVRAIVSHYLPKEVKPRREEILKMLDKMLDDGRFFDAFDFENID
jgi:hypothetical protein